MDEELLPSDLWEARHYRPDASESELVAFARRQLGSRRRLTLLLAFYGANSCRMARLHLLTASAVMLGRFCGFSPAFDAMGEALMPVDVVGRPLRPAWTRYAEACAARLPWDVRDELWLTAYMSDLDAICARGLDAAFYAEAAAHAADPTWRLLRQHMEVTLGARLIDGSALHGAIAYETAMASTMTLAVRRLFSAGWRLLGSYASAAAAALVLPAREPPRPWIGYRQCAVELIRYSGTAWTASRVYRRGLRLRERGCQASEEGWPLLAQVLSDRVGEVHPLIVRFYTNPGVFQVRALLELNTLPARLWSRIATLLVGQGLYEAGPEEIEASFRVFRRADGSMHFLRELYCRDRLRVFDSDFVVREVDGRPRLFEVFVDLAVDVEMEVEPQGDGGLRIRGRQIYLHGVRLPGTGLQVEFQSRVEKDAGGTDRVEIDGRLLMQPSSAVGRLLFCRLLRRPEQLGRIHYSATSGEFIGS